jgi:hypothetical protein
VEHDDKSILFVHVHHVPEVRFSSALQYDQVAEPIGYLNDTTNKRRKESMEEIKIDGLKRKPILISNGLRREITVQEADRFLKLLIREFNTRYQKAGKEAA